MSNIRKYSLSRKERGRSSRQPNEGKFMSESFLDSHQQKILSGGSMQYSEYQSGLPSRNHPPKATNYEFKFDEIESASVTKDKLKDYLKNKASRAQRGNSIGPASFYGIRQNINNKITNKKRFFEEDSGNKSKQDSIKIIKFVWAIDFSPHREQIHMIIPLLPINHSITSLYLTDPYMRGSM